MRLSSALLTVFLVLMSACSSSSPPRAKVGSYTVTDSDVRYNERVLRIYYPDYKENLSAGALKQLVEAYTYAEILRNNGRAVSEKTLEDEAARIDKTTLMPVMLARIKDIFGRDRDSFLKVYVLPVYVKRVIFYEFFLRDPKIQAESLGVAQRFIQQAIQNHGDFKKLALTKFTVSLANGVEIEAPKEPGRPGMPDSRSVPPRVQAKMQEQQHAQASEEGKRWIGEVIKKLKPGQVHDVVIDQQDRWWVVRYIGPRPKQKDAYLLEAAIFPKADYAEWLETERAKVELKYF